jgi:hypothetical protein
MKMTNDEIPNDEMKMTNDEIPNDERNPNDEIRKLAVPVLHENQKNALVLGLVLVVQDGITFTDLRVKAWAHPHFFTPKVLRLPAVGVLKRSEANSSPALASATSSKNTDNGPKANALPYKPCPNFT